MESFYTGIVGDESDEVLETFEVVNELQSRIFSEMLRCRLNGEVFELVTILNKAVEDGLLEEGWNSEH